MRSVAAVAMWMCMVGGLAPEESYAKPVLKSAPAAAADADAVLVAQAQALLAAGKADEALAVFKDALTRIDVAGKSSPLAVKCYEGLITIYSRSGRFREALEITDKGLAYAARAQDTKAILALAAMKPGPLIVLGRSPEALTFIDEIRRTLGTAIEPNSLVDMRLTQNRISAQIYSGKIDEGLTSAEIAAARYDAYISQKNAFSPEQRILQATLLETLGGVYIYKESYSKAIPYLESARAIYEAAGPATASNIANLDNTLGAALYKEGRFEEALQVRLKSRSAAEKLFAPGSRESRMISSNIVATLISLKRFEEAKPEIRSALEHLQLSNRRALFSPNGTTDFDRTIAQILSGSAFQAATHLAGDPVAADLAIQTFQELQGMRALPAVLQNLSRPDEKAFLTNWTAEQSETLNRIVATQKTFPTDADIQTRNEAYENLAKLDDLLQQRFPAVGSAGKVNLDALKASLAKDEALLVVQSADCCTFSALVTRDDVAFVDNNIRADRLCEMVRLHREQLGQTEELWCRMDVQGNMSRGSTPETVTAVKASITGSPSDALYQVLIAPFSTKLKKISHLYIASTGAVNALPWAALRNSRGSYLIEMHNLAVVPSIAGFAGYEQQQASKASKASLSFAGIGAPCVGGQLGKQCDAANSGSSHRGALPSGEGDLNQTLYLSALPHSGRELTRASELFGQQKFVLTGQQATKPVVLDALRTAKPNIVVFATHGLSAGEFGLKEPGLVLSPEAISDGVLTPSILLASELAKIDLGSELVVLSACSTASENSNDSTGTLSGFSRALMQAGAQNLIAVHGPVEDAAMGSFMVSFFKAYVRQQTRDPAQALRQASRKAIKKGDHRVWPLVFAASMR